MSDQMHGQPLNFKKQQRRLAMKSTRMLTAAGLSVGLMAALQTGCAGPAKVTQPAAQPEAVQKTEQEAPPFEVRSLSGKVVETLSSGGYTYLCLDKDGKKSWAAVPGTVKVEVGQEVALKPGMVMPNFTSKSLNRKFDEITFSEGWQSDKAEGSAATAAAAPAPVLSKETLGGKVVETMDSGGYTYANLQKDGSAIWVALPVTQLKIGQEVEIVNAMPMKSFTSKSLNRTFDLIYFAGGFVQKGQPAVGSAPPIAPNSTMPPGHPPIGSKQ